MHKKWNITFLYTDHTLNTSLKHPFHLHHNYQPNPRKMSQQNCNLCLMMKWNSYTKWGCIKHNHHHSTNLKLPLAGLPHPGCTIRIWYVTGMGRKISHNSHHVPSSNTKDTKWIIDSRLKSVFLSLISHLPFFFFLFFFESSQMFWSLLGFIRICGLWMSFSISDAVLWTTWIQLLLNWSHR